MDALTAYTRQRQGSKAGELRLSEPSRKEEGTAGNQGDKGPRREGEDSLSLTWNARSTSLSSGFMRWARWISSAKMFRRTCTSEAHG